MNYNTPHATMATLPLTMNPSLWVEHPYTRALHWNVNIPPVTPSWHEYYTCSQIPTHWTCQECSYTRTTWCKEREMGKMTFMENNLAVYMIEGGKSCNIKLWFSIVHHSVYLLLQLYTLAPHHVKSYGRNVCSINISRRGCFLWYAHVGILR